MEKSSWHIWILENLEHQNWLLHLPAVIDKSKISVCISRLSLQSEELLNYHSFLWRPELPSFPIRRLGSRS